MILITGPTGSGKSTTLRAALESIDRTRRNVVTLEDPIEHRIPGVNQVQVNPRAGLSFPQGLRALLRQDPDVVAIGEIRDRETAEIAMSAALTGHLVLSTLHTIDAPSAVARLLEIGVPPFLVAGAVTAVFAQRLVPTLCDPCLGRGCSRCEEGWAGRIAVFQALRMSQPLAGGILRGVATSELRVLAIGSGMGTLADDALRRVREGRTTEEKVSSVLAIESEEPRCRKCAIVLGWESAGCPYCGTPSGNRCPCGSVLLPEWRFCPGCLRPSGR